MASFCRSAISTGSRSLAAQAKTTSRRTVEIKGVLSALSSAPRSSPRASRFVAALGSVESLMPLHSAIASARLKSSIAVNSTCWSWLSQGFATTL